MKLLNLLPGILFRPVPTFRRLAEGVKWAWVPALVLLLAAALANVAVSVPLQVRAQAQWAQAEMSRLQSEAGNSPGMVKSASGGAVVVGDSGGAKSAAAPGEGDIIISEDTSTGVEGIAMTAGLVFAAVGVLASLFATAGFFFIAAKVWAKPAPFQAMLSIAALSFVPLAVRDVIQAAYQALSGTWIQHQGLSRFAAPENPLTPGGALYGLLAQIDVWSLWALVLLMLGISVAAGLERKRAVTAIAIFTVVAVVVRALPQIVLGMLAGGSS